jgi:hypothetical protein
MSAGMHDLFKKIISSLERFGLVHLSADVDSRRSGIPALLIMSSHRIPAVNPCVDALRARQITFDDSF